jgi:hypothetical protein
MDQIEKTTNINPVAETRSTALGESKKDIAAAKEQISAIIDRWMHRQEDKGFRKGACGAGNIKGKASV